MARGTRREQRTTQPPALPVLRSTGTIWPPISNPTEERRAFERGWSQWGNYVRTLAGGAFWAGPGEIGHRLSEVYRLCFEQSGGNDLGIISDFVAHCPRTVLKGTWLAKYAAYPGAFDPETLQPFPKRPRQRLFDAIAQGFKRAAQPQTLERMKNQLRPQLEVAARRLRSQLVERLRAAFEGCKMTASTSDWRLEQAQKLYQELLREYPKIVSKQQRLLGLLAQAHAFKAAVLIAAAMFEVRETAVRGKVPKD